MTTLTRQEFEKFPAYDATDPTFHENWLNPGRYWTYTPSNWRADCPNKKSYICCYVTTGDKKICIMSDEVEILDENSVQLD